VKVQDEGVVFRTCPQQSSAKQWTLDEVERLTCGNSGETLDIIFRLRTTATG
jgi:hypothetical protein